MKRFLSISTLLGLLGAGMFAMTGSCMAEEAAAVAEVAAEAPAVLNSGDTAWMIVATVLVIIMAVPGLAIFYGGLARAKNMLSVLMQVMVTFSLLSILWAVYGYSLVFTEGNAVIGGLSKAFLAGITPDSLQGTIPELLFVTFQMTFAAITPALIVGGFAERIKFSAVLLFMALWMTFAYVPMAHMVWGGGWIGELGAADFAGGTVVHINAGIAALVGALVLGKRLGYGKEAMPPHSLVMTMVGGSLLWAGWFGFNVGSELAADGRAGLAVVNTQLATAAAVIGWVFAEWLFKGKPSMLGAVSGAIAGLVAITPACGFIGPMGSIILGFVASFVSLWAVTKLKNGLGYDDTMDVFGIHGIAGIIGAIGTGIFMAPSLGGIGYAEGVTMAGQVEVQAIAVGFTVVYVGIVSFILYKVVDLVIGLRVTEDDEREGLDTASHGERAYHS
ncbi:ammonium transporter [Methylobacillus gramineus]|uniref:ammonium transporter n=1 Tax=Methylobacillus gramineus TaxID=755169 RepID=UPI001CFFED78|nr:ammonium transporter [Methylobacillus gramineus]MCB5185239.1 ammonium transporter [Methylobacillus gramineus]